MLFRPVLLVAVCFCQSVVVNAFSAVGSAAFTRRPAILVSTSTCLYSSEKETEAKGDGDSAPSEDQAPNQIKSTDILNSPAFLRRKLDVIKSDIAKVEEDIQAATVQAQEGQAEWGQQLEDLEVEFQNIQNRFSQQGQRGDEEATVNVARKMLEVLDNYDRAFAAVKPDTDEERAIEARYKENYDKILNIFAELGITEVDTVGKEFDYEFHQAVMQRPSEYDEGIVCEELQKGFVLNGQKLIRAAMVSVSA